jgi:hypothetical protein
MYYKSLLHVERTHRRLRESATRLPMWELAETGLAKLVFQHQAKNIFHRAHLFSVCVCKKKYLFNFSML